MLGITKTLLSNQEVEQQGFEGLLWGPTIFGPALFIRWGPKAQAEEGYGPDTAMQVQNKHWDTAEDDLVLGRSKVSSEERAKMV